MRNIFDEVKQAKGVLARFEAQLEELKSHKIAWDWEADPNKAPLKCRKRNVVGLFLGLNLGHMGYDLPFNGLMYHHSGYSMYGYVFVKGERDDLVRLVMDGSAWRGTVKENKTTLGLEEWKKSLGSMEFFRLLHAVRETGFYEVTEVYLPKLLKEKFYLINPKG